MFLGLEGALGVHAARDTGAQTVPAVGHATGKERGHLIFASLMAAALGTLEPPVILVPPAPAVSSESAEVLAGVSDPMEPNTRFPACALGLPVEPDGESLWTVHETAGTARQSSEPVPLTGFSARKQFIAVKTELPELPEPNRPVLDTGEVRGHAETPHVGAQLRGVRDAGLISAGEKDKGLDREGGASSPTVQLVKEHLSPTQMEADVEVPQAWRTVERSEAVRISHVTTHEEEAVHRGPVTEHGLGSREAGISLDFEAELGESRLSRDTGSGERLEASEPIESFDTGSIGRLATVETAPGPDVHLRPGAEGRPAGRQDVSVTDTRALAERLREEALKRLPRSVELKLDPPRLGSVTAVLTARGQDIAVKFVAQSHEAIQALETSAGELARSFSELGLTLSGFTVDQGHAQHTSSRGERGGSVHSAGRKKARSFGVEAVPSQPSASYLPALSGSHLDYIV